MDACVQPLGWGRFLIFEPFTGEILVTPARGCLLGITRKKIFEAVKKYGGDLKIEERDIGKIPLKFEFKICNSIFLN